MRSQRPNRGYESLDQPEANRRLFAELGERDAPSKMTVCPRHDRLVRERHHLFLFTVTHV